MIDLAPVDKLLLTRAEALLRSPDRVSAVNGNDLLRQIDEQTHIVRTLQLETPSLWRRVRIRWNLLQLTYTVEKLEGRLE